jgi:solute carrier family 25 phosphate transporter 23/24/25/41
MLIDLFIGGAAGIISRTLTAPLDLIKMQQQNKYLKDATFNNVIRKEGIRHLWKGNLVNCTRVFPQFAINYAVYEKAKNNFYYVQDSKLRNFICGGIGGLVATTATYPLETIRTRMTLQMNKSHYKTPFDVIRKTSPTTIYKGVGISMVGFSSFSAFNFMFFNKYNDYLNDCGISQSVSKFFAGGFAGISSLSITYPTDLLRRRFQMHSFNKETPNYKGAIDAIKKIVYAEGISGLYSGLTVSYIRIFPCLAIQFWCLEEGKKIFK